MPGHVISTLCVVHYVLIVVGFFFPLSWSDSMNSCSDVFFSSLSSISSKELSSASVGSFVKLQIENVLLCKAPAHSHTYELFHSVLRKIRRQQSLSNLMSSLSVGQLASTLGLSPRICTI
ncbi:hypothetical protein JOB18_048725 [Solea senegalensis]|uniref:Uncharacterized protein n=1 Tax=Solea senegalensis TaxID=28829 RepID=A0AAV6RQV8_SOLSE|nr:hypothetical protein JOB18_048725 [Solea senegalensis]